MKTRPRHKYIAIFLTLNFLTSIVPVNILWASNNGPNAPEASAFEPVNATDMVNLSSGDMSYVLPLLEIDGFPVTLSYHAGIPMDMEASWVGLGWNINTGTIARGVSANPDDWGLGRRLNLTYLQGEIDSYSINVGVGVAKAAEVGVGLSWGSNKSISGSVSASVGPVSASIDTNGNYGVGINPLKTFKGAFGKISDVAEDKDKSPFGGSIGISGNVKRGGLAANISVGGSSDHVSAGMGVSISGQGIGSSFSVGGSNGSKGGDARGGGAGISMNSFSAGDYSYNTKGFYIPLTIGIFSFGFGHTKTKISLKNAYRKYAYGALYHNVNTLYETSIGSDYLPGSINTSFDDYQRRNVFGDVYEQELPRQESDFISDYRKSPEKLNFTYAGYDSYNINATGIGGALVPIIGQNTVLIGEGYDGSAVDGNYDKTKVFYHNAKGTGNLIPSKSLSTAQTNSNRLSFSFDGQINEDAIVSGNSFNNYTGTTLNINNFINTGSSINNRPRSGSYIEVYTNAEINTYANVQQKGVLLPSSLKTNNSSLSRLSQGYMAEGIGGYKITTPDGKTYHFMQPVYQYEQIQHSFLNFDANNTSIYNSNSKRDGTPYATHWLLTAITGPDYVDDGNHFPDEGDFGYWLRLDHGQWSNAFAWRSPYDNKQYDLDGGILSLTNKSKKNYSTYIDNEVEKSDPGHFLQGRKDLFYLDKIVSKNQSAIFVKDIRHDAFGTSADYNYEPNHLFKNKIDGGPTTDYTEKASYEKEYQLKLDKIIIVNKPESIVSVDKTSGNGTLSGINSEVYPNRYEPNGFFDE
ncbi:hypothetical protein [Winogradskyella luteola]|uniref:Uncharacterized protein n=1 Tax=Winogradskyella luteola TaxID=2828330 RepID=A0A9X1F8J9_9FLAO|nr:hypothetical protein [Winogradskyella luteola]MBV7269076.1 hypothetical protein [Winogradskyella luteola]